MRLLELAQGLCPQSGIPDVEIEGITCDSRQVEEGFLFVCVKGGRFDGHDHAPQALERGAAAVITQRDLSLPNQMIVPDTRYAYAILCGNFYGNPSRQLKLIGITGTNGKTTTTYILKYILEQAGHKTGLIGTIHNEIGDMTFPARHTTPDPAQLQALFRRMADAGCEYVVMEVSSHALDQQRVAGCRFLTGAFTNLTQDHLDYHGSMENYFAAKAKLFDMTETAVVNADDAYGRRLIASLRCPSKTFSLGDGSGAYCASHIEIKANGSRFLLEGEGKSALVEFPMPGKFAVANAMTAALCALSAGIPFSQVTEALNSCPGVRGRTEVLPTNTDYTVICDYAHSPDGIEKILTAIREFAPGRITILFGCPGKRDRTKRRKMTEIAARLADFVVLTSDNPRDENPQEIIEDALPGLLEHDTPYEIIPDRYRAVRWALEHAQKDDILLLAGKGHEDYQVLDFGTIYFDEKQIVAELLEKIRQEKGKGE